MLVLACKERNLRFHSEKVKIFPKNMWHCLEQAWSLIVLRDLKALPQAVGLIWDRDIAHEYYIIACFSRML